MENQIRTFKANRKYDEIINLTAQLLPGQCDSAEMAHDIGKAFEKKNAFTQSIPWYIRSYELNSTDEALGMVLGVCFACGEYEKAKEVLLKEQNRSEGYYYSAGRYELAFRMQTGIEEEIELLEAALEVQDEETYMMRLVTLYLQAGRDKDAGRLCKKAVRLFISGEAVDYALALQNEIKEGKGLAYIEKNPWNRDAVFKHISFDRTQLPENKRITLTDKGKSQFILERLGGHTQSEPKKEKKDRIAPIIEKCMEEIIGMQELKTSLNSIFNMMQTSKKRAGANAILKDNIRILGPDGCGKTTAAMTAAKAMARIGITQEEKPIIADYFTLVGTTTQETHDNVQKLFESAVNSCVIIENIHEFEDSGAYSLGLDALDQIVKAYLAAEEKIPLIITGRETEVEGLLQKKRRLGELFNLPPVVLGCYTTEELVKIAYNLANKKNLILDEDANNLLTGKLEHMSKQPDFKFSRDLNRMINEAYMNQVARLAGMRHPKENDYYVIKVEDFGVSEQAETVEELLAELDRLTGLANVKTQVKKIVNQVTIQKLREESGIGAGQGHGSLHLVFMGNAGTGKTTIARILGKIYKRLGVLPSGQLVECTRRDLVSQFVGATAQKVSDKVKEAMGGILFIDEAYTLCQDDFDSFGREAIESLLADVENHRDNLMVILAGYSDRMDKFMSQNQGLRSRIPTDIFFEDYSIDEMLQIFKQNVKDKGLVLDAGLDEEIQKLLETKSRKKDFGNARGVRNVFEAVVLNQNNRLGEMEPTLLSKNDFLIIKKEDLGLPEEETISEKGIQEYMQELNNLTGLQKVKDKVDKLVKAVIVKNGLEAKGLSAPAIGTLHMVFKGNAGTGKTTVARLLGEIYKQLGVLSSGHLVECNRSNLVAGYVGQTAAKVEEKVQEALGGVLFIDEAYALAKGGENDFGREAIDTLVADIENNRKDFMVIIAGYPEEMDDFLKQNQGLHSRFPNEIIFEDYSAEELLSIFQGMIKSQGLIMSGQLRETAIQLIDKYAHTEDFGNARGIRNLVDRIIEQRNVRIAQLLESKPDATSKELQTVIEEDLNYFL